MERIVVIMVLDLQFSCTSDGRSKHYQACSEDFYLSSGSSGSFYCLKLSVADLWLRSSRSNGRCYGILVAMSGVQADVYDDISVAQGLYLTPKQVVKDHLGFSEDTLSKLP